MAMYIPVTGGRSNLLTPGHIFTKLGNPKFDTDVAGPAQDVYRTFQLSEPSGATACSPHGRASALFG